MRKHLVSILIIAMILCTSCVQSVFGQDEDQTTQVGSPPEYTEYEQLEGKIFGLLIGAPFENLIRSKVGMVRDFEYFNSVADMQLALMRNKIDAYMTSNAVAEWQVNQESRIAKFPKDFSTSTYGFAFRKGDPAMQDWQDGEIDHINKLPLIMKVVNGRREVQNIPHVIADWIGLIAYTRKKYSV